MKYICVLIIRFYQKYLSPLKRKPCCRFTPTCSAYAVEAFMNRGFFVGFALTVYRILRCNPFCAGGFDPVPVSGFKNPKGFDSDINNDFNRFVFVYNLPLFPDSENNKTKK